MPWLPNEIWDQIWLQASLASVEPRIVQAKWVHDGRFHVPAFYTAQPQPILTQVCHGSRQVAAKHLYSRIADGPFTGVGGFWWNEKDVLYVDQDFYRQLRNPRMSLFIGRDYITRIAADIEIDDDATAMTKLLFDWFPRLSQLFYLCPSRLVKASPFKDPDVMTQASPYDPSVSYSPRRSVRGHGLAGRETASTKSLPITTFLSMGSLDPVPSDIFIRVQGLTDELHSRVSPKEWRASSVRLNGGQSIPFFEFEREGSAFDINSRDSLSRDEGACFANSGHSLAVRMLTSMPSHRNTCGSNYCQYATLWLSLSPNQCAYD